jgi:hypothetical protein
VLALCYSATRCLEMLRVHGTGSLLPAASPQGVRSCSAVRDASYSYYRRLGCCFPSGIVEPSARCCARSAKRS